MNKEERKMFYIKSPDEKKSAVLALQLSHIAADFLGQKDHDVFTEDNYASLMNAVFTLAAMATESIKKKSVGSNISFTNLYGESCDYSVTVKSQVYKSKETLHNHISDIISCAKDDNQEKVVEIVQEIADKYPVDKIKL